MGFKNTTGIHYSVICLLVHTVTSMIFAAPPAVEFDGMLSGSGRIKESVSKAVNINVRYIPLLGIEISPRIDVELSGNIFTCFNSERIAGITDSLKIKPYRGWIRYTGTHFEARLGLQKINFGQARILRSLMWFDSLDPTDPLQFADGVYGLRLKYNFRNNADTWFWGLYGNDDLKGWEMYATEKNIPEIGGRIQYPFGNVELAVTAHHRTVEPDRIAENRIALDGYWDAGIGLWFESALVRADFDGDSLDWQSFMTFGADYTFPYGNGLNTTSEHLLWSAGDDPFDNHQRNNISSISFSYPLGMMDSLSLFSYYIWDTNTQFHFLSWQRAYDNWVIHISGHWTSEAGITPFSGGGSGTIGKQGIQLMVIFNH